MQRKWEPSSNDAMSLAAFRWFANTLENASIELYATNRASFERIEEVMRTALRELVHAKVSFAVSEEENGCPDGYVICNGVCAPSCDWFEEAAASAKSYGKPPVEK